MPESTAPSAGTRKRGRVVLLIVLAVGLITASWFLTDQPETQTILVTFPSGTVLEAEVADTPEKLLFGLAFREELPPRQGMLYIFETTDRHRVKTRGFRIPVDMIWADESRHVVHIIESAPPCPQDPCPYHGPPPEKVRYLIQTAAGFAEKEHLASGVELKFTLRLP